eukprot:7093060-Pyramimonas_sp.AAC.1
MQVSRWTSSSAAWSEQMLGETQRRPRPLRQQPKARRRTNAQQPPQQRRDRLRHPTAPSSSGACAR